MSSTIPQSMDKMIKAMGMEFAIPLNRTDEHASKLLSISETESFLRNFSNYTRQLRAQLRTDIAEKTEEAQIAQRAKLLEEELRFALTSAEDVKALRAKTIHLIEEIRLEKDKRMVEVQKVDKYAHHIAVLEDHIEKMVKLMKVEAGVKIKFLETQRYERKRLVQLMATNERQDKVNFVQKKLIGELRESSRVLVDQLQLMDEKYFQLREKLDQNRAQSKAAMERAKRENSELRLRFLLATGSSLDKVKIDPNKAKLVGLSPKGRNSGIYDDEEEGNGDYEGEFSPTGPSVSFAPNSRGGNNQSTFPGSNNKGDTTRPQTAPAGKRTLAVREATKHAKTMQIAEAPATLSKEEQMDVVMKKIQEKDDALRGKKWSRENVNKLIGKH